MRIIRAMTNTAPIPIIAQSRPLGIGAGVGTWTVTTCVGPGGVMVIGGAGVVG